MRTLTILMTIPLLAAAACGEFGSDYVPILDGPKTTTYLSDLESCQDLARGQSFDENTIGATVIGGVVGGAFGDQSGGVTSAEGALIGAVLGLFGGAIDETEQRQSIARECMKGRGHRVVG
jgi:uncharacterized protein YcfJ